MSLEIYKENIIDHYNNPRNKGRLKTADLTIKETNASCGDSLIFQILLDRDKDTIKDVRFDGEGCSISIASASMMTEDIIGKKLSELRGYSKERILENLGIPISAPRMKCALLPLKALKVAVYDIKNKD